MTRARIPVAEAINVSSGSGSVQYGLAVGACVRNVAPDWVFLDGNRRTGAEQIHKDSKAHPSFTVE
jgi:hypothetical protein